MHKCPRTVHEEQQARQEDKEWEDSKT